ncbi:MAG: transglutaminase family protein [Pseudomonadota bacterium]
MSHLVRVLRRAVICVTVLGLTAVTATATAHNRPSVIVERILANINATTDLARVKLRFDKLVDPNTDIAKRLAEIDRLAAKVRSARPRPETSRQKLDALRQMVYAPGAWNNNRPFRYDLSDPTGQNPKNRLLSTYLDTRKGNCISMPFLFLVLAERIGLKVAAALAPLHVFVRYTDETGRTFNLESTSGAGFTRDLWYRKHLPMTDQAIANGLYLRSLSRRETAAAMAMIVVEHLIRHGRYTDAIATADAVLRVFPQLAYALVKRGTAYGHLIRVHYAEKYMTFNAIPITERPRLKT